MVTMGLNNDVDRVMHWLEEIVSKGSSVILMDVI